MSECTGIDNVSKQKTSSEKPLISIVMATYNPRMDWLKEQLESLERQTYRPLELLVLDDCSSKISLSEIEKCIAESISSIPYQIMQNEENLGSTKTFEKLTVLAKGEYIAYCDQDDRWRKDKVELLVEHFTSEHVKLAYSDVLPINESGEAVANGITALRRRHRLYEGIDLVSTLLIQNFVIGCTMLVRSNFAKASIPFINSMVHDHYLALMASLDGIVALCKDPLVFYRIHEENQTKILAKVKNKQDYYDFKIRSFLERMEELEKRNEEKNIPQFSFVRKWAEARVSYYNGDLCKARDIWKHRRIDSNISMFELIVLKMPNFMFDYTLNKIKKGKL